MSHAFGLIIESLVAILLMLTIGYCMLLNRRLKLLKADEHSLRATIAELITATEIAERAVAGLRITARDCEAGLGERLSRAERLANDLDRAVAAGNDMHGRLLRIVAAWRPHEPNFPRNDPQTVAVAARDFADRLRTRMRIAA